MKTCCHWHDIRYVVFIRFIILIHHHYCCWVRYSRSRRSSDYCTLCAPTNSPRPGSRMNSALPKDHPQCETECEIDVFDVRSTESRDPLEIEICLILRWECRRIWSSPTNWSYSNRVPPSLPRPFPRNSLGKEFWEFSAGGIWREQWNFPFPKEPCGHCSSRTSRNLGQGWSPVILSVECRPGAVYSIISSTQTFECVSNPIRATSHGHCWP